MAKQTKQSPKRVLAVVGSPRKKGNSDLLCDRVIAGARSIGAHVDKIYLTDLHIESCHGCHGCQGKRAGICFVEDDMAQVYPKLQQADALILASPVYFFTMSAQMKLFIDKLYPLTTEKGLSIKAKRAVICMTYGAADPLQSGVVNAAHTFSDICTFAGITMNFVHGSAFLKGEIRKNRAVLQQAYKAGKEIFG